MNNKYDSKNKKKYLVIYDYYYLNYFLSEY